MANTRQFKPNQIKKIRKLRDNGETFGAIAKQFNVSVPTIRQICLFITYKDVD